MTPSAAEFVSLLPEGSFVDDEGQLVVGGCRLVDLADQYGTPMLVVDEASVRSQVRRFDASMREGWANSRVVFASKAFPCTAMYEVMAQEGVGVDVAGGGELVMALAGGVSPSKIIVHGNAKTTEELSMALEAQVGTIVIDNFDDIDRLEQLARREQGVLIRVLPRVSADTHEAIATGQVGSKFGLDGEQALEAIARVRASEHLRLDGLHAHIGSQILDTGPFALEVAALAEYGDFDVYDLGGGLGVRYTYHQDPPSPEEWCAAVTSAARRHLPSSARLIVEPGRSMVARSGFTLYRVTTVKRGSSTFVAVDGGMADNLDVSLYGERFEASVVDRVGGGELVTLVGRHCESGDTLIRGVAMRSPRVGDVVVVAATGAYTYTMQNNYNGALRPPLVFVGGGRSQLRVRRETYTDFFRRDVPDEGG